MVIKTCKACQLPIAELQHTLNLSCPFCERSFRRADAARRHARTCPSRANRPLPEAKRGRKSRACDACSRDKISCDGAHPCARCTKRRTAVVCTYSSLCHDVSHREAGAEPSSAFIETTGRDERMTLSFLLEWSDPNRDPMLGMMESETKPEDPARAQAQEPAMPGLSAWLEGTIDPALLLLDFPTDGTYGNTDNLSPEVEGTIPRHSTGAAEKRMQTLEAIFRGMLVSKPSLQTGFDSSYSNGFFVPSHVRTALKTQWERSSQLATFIHWPTFDPEQVSLPLLLAVVVVRTAYLDYSCGGHAPMLNTLFLELVEEYIFQKLRECVDASDPSKLISEGNGFDTCRAAAVIISVQCTINNPTARERIATERIPYVSAILRKSGLLDSRHNVPLKEVSWGAFAHTEAQIRLVMSLHMNCALLASFCNHPPAVAVREMVGSLPCTNDLWEACTQSAFEARQSLHPNHEIPSSFSEASTLLLNDELASSTSSKMNNLSVNQLFVLIIGFQSVVYNFRASMLCGGTTSIFLRALDRWAALWFPAMQRVPEEELKGLGMIRIAPELAFLMKRVLEVLGTPEAEGLGYFDGTVRYDTTDLHEFVSFQGLSAPPMTG